MSRLRSHLSYANVVSTLCLFIVLGGTSYAAVTITGNNVKDGSLSGNDIRNRSITTSDILPGTINTGDVGWGSLNGGDIADGSLLSKDFEAGQLPAGPQGQKGDTGATGAAGSKGDTGATGAKGDTGAPGASGISGVSVVEADSAVSQDNSRFGWTYCPEGTKRISGISAALGQGGTNELVYRQEAEGDRGWYWEAKETVAVNNNADYQWFVRTTLHCATLAP